MANYVKKEFFHVETDPAFKEKVMDAAKDNNRSLSNYVREALKNQMRRDRSKKQ